MITRRGLLEAAGGLLAFGGGGALTTPARGAESTNSGLLSLSPLLPAGTRSEAVLATLPGKKPLIKLTYRPPNYEAPLAYLRTAITPNDEFFVRYHLADIPQIDAGTWKLSLGGEGANGDLQIGLNDLKRLPAFEVVAVCQCSGNRRGLVQPHVAGVQWGRGAMGCARWKGARLKDVLDLVGLNKEAVEVVFDGADGPVLDKTPDFVKSLPVWKAIEETTLVAYEMNGEPLPHWNGFPARIVAPGWTATYWMKHITSITVVTRPFDGYWMKTAYRIPVKTFPLVARFISQETAVTTPITEIIVNSLIISPRWSAHQGGTQDGHKRNRLGRRLWHPFRRNLGRQWQELDGSVARRRSRQIRFSRVELRVYPQAARKIVARGPRRQQDRPNPDPGADPKPGGRQ
jgi:DMSO/TMAO reductase YedYZ molybdopterin-dependent catalytic subunit